MTAEGHDADVLIVGAGLAGLSAARILTAYGARPLVVEARQRLGGRASTAEFPAAPELGIMESCPVEEGCNYLHGCSMDHPLFLLAGKLGIPTALAAGDIGCQYSGWESTEIAEWHDPDRGGELIPLEEIVDAALLLQHVTYGVAYLAMEDSPPEQSDGSTSEEEGETLPDVAVPDGGGAAVTSPGDAEIAGEAPHLPRSAKDSLEALFQRALCEVLERRHKAGHRATTTLTPRERSIVHKIRGRHFAYVAPCSRMPAATVAASTSFRRARQVFMDGSWPHSDKGLIQGMTRLWKRKLSLIEELGAQGPEACVVPMAEDEGEDRLLLGRGFQAFVEAFAENVEVVFNDPVQSIAYGGGGGVTMTLKSGRSLRAPFGLVTVPSGVLAGIATENAIAFLPPLPEEKVQAIKRLSIPKPGACTHEKVVLRWATQEPFVAAVLDRPGAALQFETTDKRFHFLNLHKYGRSGQLLCHIWADAEWHEHATLSDREVVTAVVDGLRAMFPCNPRAADNGSEASDTCTAANFVAFPAQWKVTRWSTDPFALGAYSELQDPEASEADRSLYARPEGPLLFTGEGAVSGPAGAQCTHGAVLGGANAAMMLLSQGLAKNRAQSGDGEDRPRVGELLGSGPLGLDVATVVEVLATGRSRTKRRRGREE